MAQPTKPSLTLKRQLKAAPDKVFAAWTRPEALKAWFGPSDEMKILSAETDPRPGGRYRIVAQRPGEEQHRVSGTYKEIVENKRLVFSWAWESTPERESLVTVELTPKDGGTEIKLTHEQFFDEAARDRHQHGWTGTLDRLARYLG